MSAHLQEPVLQNTRTEQFEDLLFGEVTLVGETFPVQLPIYHILTASIVKGQMEQQGCGRYIEYLATLQLCQDGVSSRLKLSRDVSGAKLWTPSCLEFASKGLSVLSIDLFELNGQPDLEVVGSPGGTVEEEVNRFLRLASNRVRS